MQQRFSPWLNIAERPVYLESKGTTFPARCQPHQEETMTHIETARINEMLGLQIAVIRDAAAKLNGDDLEHLEQDIAELENTIKKLREILEGLPHLA